MARDTNRRADEAVRITTAGSSRREDIAARQKRYLLSMSLRSACFIGAVVAALAGVGWIWPLLIAGALILPYSAGVMANNSGTGSDGFELQDGDYGLPHVPAPAEKAR